MRIEISDKGKSHYGDTIEFNEDGCLSINMFDGVTQLNEEEAKELGYALLKWANRGHD